MDQQDKSVRRRPAKSTSDHTPEPRTSEIRAEIEETRAEIGETVEAIQDRLRPGAGSIARGDYDTGRSHREGEAYDRPIIMERPHAAPRRRLVLR